MKKAKFFVDLFINVREGLFYVPSLDYKRFTYFYKQCKELGLENINVEATNEPNPEYIIIKLNKDTKKIYYRGE